MRAIWTLYDRYGPQALELGWRSGARKALAQAIRARGIVAMAESRWDDALADIESAFTRYSDLGTTWEEARTRYALAGLYRRRGEPGDDERAHDEFTRAKRNFSSHSAVRDIARTRYGAGRWRYSSAIALKYVPVRLRRCVVVGDGKGRCDMASSSAARRAATVSAISAARDCAVVISFTTPAGCLRGVRCISPRCARCGMPIARTATQGTFRSARPARAKRHVARDVRTADHLNMVHLRGIVPSGTPRKFCPRCVQGRPRCDLCRAPVADGAQPLADGQYRCALCLSDIVPRSPMCERLHEAVAQVARVLWWAILQDARI